MKQTATKPGKKPYHSPKLVIYGDVRELTETGEGNLRGDYWDGSRTQWRTS